MKRWGVQLFAITFFVKEALLFLVNDISYPGIVISTFFLVSMLLFYKRMDLNLYAKTDISQKCTNLRFFWVTLRPNYEYNETEN